MEEKRSKAQKIIMTICIAILIIFMISIVTRFFTRQIIIEKMGIDNAITRLIFWDNLAAGTDNASRINNEEGEVIFDTNWGKLYPFSNNSSNDSNINTEKPALFSSALRYIDSYVNSIKSVEGKIETYSSDLLSGQKVMTQWHKSYDNLLSWDWKYTSPDDDSAIIFMQNGYLTYVQPEVDDYNMEMIAESISDFNKFLQNRGTSFYYINAGSKVSPVDKQLSYNDAMAEFTNENADRLLTALDERNVNAVDMRAEMISDELDWYESYYKTDHHWTNETGLWAAGKIAKMLNEKNGFSYNLKLYDKNSYDMETYPDIMFGGQGRVVTFSDATTESFTSILPRYETDFTVEIPTKGIHATGSYNDVLYDTELLEEIKNYSQDDHLSAPGAYETPICRNDALCKIKNNMPIDNADKKILIIQDSFCWFSTSYLACDTGEIHTIHPREFTGSIRSYVEEYDPDIVIVMMCERNIKPIEPYTHSSMMDFR